VLGLFAWSTFWVYLATQTLAGAADGLAFWTVNPEDR
jgi:hypothetical protein